MAYRTGSGHEAGAAGDERAEERAREDLSFPVDISASALAGSSRHKEVGCIGAAVMKLTM